MFSMDISGGVNTGSFDSSEFHWSRGGDLNSTPELMEPTTTIEKGQFVEGVDAELLSIRHSIAQLSQHRGDERYADVLSQTLSKLDASSPDYAAQVHALYELVTAEVQKVRHDG